MCVTFFRITKWIHRAEMSAMCEWAVPVVRGALQTLTWTAPQPQLATVPFTDTGVTNTFGPVCLDALFKCLADVCLCVDNPHAVVGIKRDGKEHRVWVRLTAREDERVFARIWGLALKQKQLIHPLRSCDNSRSIRILRLQTR